MVLRGFLAILEVIGVGMMGMVVLGWLIDRLVDWLIDWLIDWLVDWLIGWLIG